MGALHQHQLNADAKQQPDQLGKGMSSSKSYIVVVQGGADAFAVDLRPHAALTIIGRNDVVLNRILHHL
jgi:hypothetical protein